MDKIEDTEFGKQMAKEVKSAQRILCECFTLNNINISVGLGAMAGIIANELKCFDNSEELMQKLFRAIEDTVKENNNGNE